MIQFAVSSNDKAALFFILSLSSLIKFNDFS